MISLENSKNIRIIIEDKINKYLKKTANGSITNIPENSDSCTADCIYTKYAETNKPAIAIIVTIGDFFLIIISAIKHSNNVVITDNSGRKLFILFNISVKLFKLYIVKV